MAATAESALLEAVRAHPVPAHVAIIMDGNGRWATQRGLPRVAGHREGVKAARAIVRAADAAGLRFLTLYAFSTENWNRPEDEVTMLMRLLEESIYRELPDLMENKVRLRVIGRRPACRCPSVAGSSTSRARRATTRASRSSSPSTTAGATSCSTPFASPRGARRRAGWRPARGRGGASAPPPSPRARPAPPPPPPPAG